MSLKAYQKTVRTTASPRQTEYQLFAQITAHLLQAAEAGKKDANLIDALDRNKRLWQVLASDCKSPDNQLPEKTKASIISLSIWVMKHSSAIMRGDEKVEDLVEVNRIIMKGLNANPGAPAE